MGRVNQPEDIGSVLRALRAEIKSLRDRVGNISAYIGQGGLTIGEDGSFKMIDDTDTEIVYMGPDELGRQVIKFVREGGARILRTFFSSGGQFWSMHDKFDRTIMADDGNNGGLARPWLHVPMHPMWSQTGFWAYRTVDAASIVSETTLWEGRIGLVSHPYIEAYGTWGQASGTNSPTYRLYVGGTLVQTWTPAAFQIAVYSASIASLIDQPWIRVHLTVQATGTGQAAVGLQGVWLRQSPD